MANFVVQRKAPQELLPDDIEAVKKCCLAEGWGPYTRPDDLSHFYSGPPFIESGTFIGVLDGEIIGHVVASKYGESINVVQYIAMFLVEKPQRGKGYGLKIWNAMWETLHKNCSISLDSAVDMIPKYETMGLQPEWTNREYIIPVSAIMQKYKMSENSRNILVKPLNEVGLEKVLSYDTLICGIPRKDFLQKWTTLPSSHTWVATNESGDIVGYIVMRQGVDKEDMLIGPLFPDSIQIAQKLLYIAAEATDAQTSAERLRITMPVCESENPNATHRIEKDFGTKAVIETVRMYSKKPNYCLNKMFAISSPGFG